MKSTGSHNWLAVLFKPYKIKKSGVIALKKTERFKVTFFMLFTVLLLCAGCKKMGSEDYLGDTDTNTMTINEDGTILEIACQDFSGVSYDISNLEDTIKSEVEEYRTKYGETDETATVTFLQFENKNDFVRVALEYANLDSYNRFNNTDYADGIVTELATNTDMQLTDLGGNAVSLADVLNDSFRMFEISGDYTLTLNGSVLYYNSDAVKGDDGKTVITDGLGTAVIIYQ